ncbi:hypothetical protein PIB30_070769 [Stylosanthes scabra]|uniref:Uncharacterized protein n=1 Tax=Stylosanthes scabra TaxID=79078 RepID=A0ABU6YMJ2_9FABA|nr:hypothetical protein [Stylosanthes scabra]
MRKPCCDKEGTIKGAWSKQEDQKLIDYIQLHGEGCWRSLPKAAGLHRCGKSCRLRWINYLRPDIKRGNFDQDEEDLIIKLHALLGNRWSLIAGRLPGRTDNEIKNYWNSHIRRKLINRGIDPNNHKLYQTFPLPNKAPHTEPSFDSMNQHQTLLPSNKPSFRVVAALDDDDDDDRSSDTHHSCLLETSSASHQLNLDLTIAFPADSSTTRLFTLAEEDKNKNNMPKPSTSENVDESTPILLLFQ